MQFFKKNRYQSIDTYEVIFWLFVASSIALIAMSYPMMKLRYDIWEHVDRIRAMVLDGALKSPGKRYWYACWAFVFKIFDVSNIFTMAIVIHRVQFIANCIMIYFAAKQLFEPLLSLDRQDQHQNQWLSSLALSSVVVWLGVIGTFSFIQQAWIMWYSVNYQITLSFLLLSISLFVNLLTVQQSRSIQAIKILMASALIILILFFHAGELAYFIFYIPIFFICFIDKLKINIKHMVIGSVLVIAALYFGIGFYQGQTPLLITLIKNNELSKIAVLINEKGTWNAIDGGNRYAGNWNEFYKANVIALIGVGLLGIFNVISINKKVLAFICLSLVFCFAPTYVFSSGFLSLVSYEGIVNRYYFASLLFISTPLCIYLSLTKFNFSKQPTNILIGTLILVAITYQYSKIHNHQGVFYQNLKSIENGLKASKLDVEISDSEVASITKQVAMAENSAGQKSLLFCGPYEKVYIVVYFLNKKNAFLDRPAGRSSDYSTKACVLHAKNMGHTVVYLE